MVTEPDRRTLLSDVAVVIPARDAAATLGAALAAVKGLAVAEIIVAVAPSTDDTLAIARRAAAVDDRVRVIENPAGSSAAGLNLALQATSAPVLARIDAHTVPAPEYFPRAVELLDRTGAAGVGGIQDPEGVTAFGRAVAVALGSRFGSGGARHRVGGSPGPVETVYLGVYRREVLVVAEGWDEGLDRNADYELNHRIRRAGGLLVFDPSLVVRYQVRERWRDLVAQQVAFGRAKWTVMSRHPRSIRPRQLAPPTLVAAVVVAVVGRRGARAGARVVTLGYAAAVVGVSWWAGMDPSTRAMSMVVYPTLHMGWGGGFWWAAVTAGSRRLRRYLYHGDRRSR